MMTRTLYLLLLVLSCRVQVSGAQAAAFQWHFTSTSISTTIQECQTLAIAVTSRTNNTTALGAPPYYMIAFAPGGTTTTSLVGIDPTNLSWTVNQPAGTTLMLSMSDANGDAGGIPASPYNVFSGTSTICLPPSPSSVITITSSPPGGSTISTCEPVTLTVTGGTEPYNLTFAAFDSSVVTNVSLQMFQNVFTYINRASPDGKLLATVSDANGHWAVGPDLWNTAGSTNVTCPNLISFAGNTSSAPSSPAPSLNTSSTPPTSVFPSSLPYTSTSSTISTSSFHTATPRHRTSLIAGLTTSIVLLFLLSLSLFLYFRRSRTRHETGKNTLPFSWSWGTDPNHNSTVNTGVLEIGATLQNKSTGTLVRIPPLHTQASAPSPSITEWRPHQRTSLSNHFEDNRQSNAGPGTGRPLLATNADNEDTNPSSTPRNLAVSSKCPEARTPRGAQGFPDNIFVSSSAPMRLDPEAHAPRTMSLEIGQIAHTSNGVGVGDDEAPSVIFMHRDGGFMRVQELPPPYLER